MTTPLDKLKADALRMINRIELEHEKRKLTVKEEAFVRAVQDLYFSMQDLGVTVDSVIFDEKSYHKFVVPITNKVTINPPPFAHVVAVCCNIKLYSKGMKP